ncbi:Acetyltransferase (GNAT) domain-containing protein [Rhizobium sp. RU33A]|uniref:GNAT family N-acetyltransferase n=1 Tax=Rhizobium sp. RU33A TaxID=1907413 RepID=UPI0009564AD4|nr:GNAT family N-acetyltransferase [Rhizobium sp. RU33A]SIP94258.1 Acetyltransferase (GNAT) domain-containing protein [Rhizobium sp. RU33A]
MLETLTLREGYFEDPNAFRALADLLQDVFGIDIGLQGRFGGPDPSSMPFGYFDGTGRCVANFSVFSMPLVINGRVVKAAGFQSGAVRPAFRGQGIYRDLMQRAFAWADKQGFEAGVLLTDKPELYHDYSFRVVPQFSVCGEVTQTVPAEAEAREIDLEDMDDVALVLSILADREPVSRQLSVVRQSEMFLLNAALDPEIRLSDLPGFDAILAWKLHGGTLQMLDIAARQIPSMSEIRSALSVQHDRIEVFFPTDRLEWSGNARVYDGSCALMVRGLQPSDIPTPSMLSPMADF